jgi:pathogenesis-related protein 1
MTHRITWIALCAVLIGGLVGSVMGMGAAQVTPAQQTAMLAAHNTLRRNTATAETQRLGQAVTIPDLTWNSAAAATAQAWANNLLATNTFAHNPNAAEFGENIFFESGPDPATSGDRAFTSWASEAASYTWDTNACTADCSHYTQIVWAGTTSVGCGVATNGTTTIWVCDYAPRGNVAGQRPYEPGGPATQPPATQPPATQPPATQPPATQPPATQPPATQPPATQPPATTGGAATWTGSWTVADFGWGAGGTLVLRQNGAQVTGTYTYADPSGCGTQSGTVTGTLAAGGLTVTYTETGCAGDDAGVVQLMLSASGASFSGSWSGTRAGR